MILQRLAAAAVLISISVGCGRSSEKIVRHGTADLSSIDFQTSSPISLAGEWEFYYDTLIPPSDFTSGSRPASYQFIPGSWAGRELNGRKLPQYGFATYRARLLLPPNSPPLSIFTTEMNSCYILTANGDTILRNGTPGTAPAQERENRSWAQGTLTSPQETTDLVIHISNFHYMNGGPVLPIRIASPEQSEKFARFTLAVNFLIIGFLLYAGIHNVQLYLNRRSEKAYLLMFLLCFNWGLRMIVSGYEIRPITLLTHDLPQGFLMISELIPYFLEMPFLLFFINRFGSSRFLHWYAVTISVFAIAASAVVISSPNLLGAAAANLYVIPTFLAIPAAFYAIFKSIRNRVKGSGLLLAGFSVLTASIINDLLLFMEYIESPYCIGFGFSALIIFYSSLLSKRYGSAFHEAARLSVEMVKKNRELQRLSSMKDEFLANTSHELRTPLHGIIGITESLSSDPAVQASAALQKNLSLVVQSARRLTGLVNDILDFSKMSHNDLTLHPQPLNVSALVKVVLPHFAAEAQKKGVRLICRIEDADRAVLADEDRLTQILFNIIGNAVKFSDHGQITVSCRRQELFTAVQVEDTGTGISAEDLAVIFEPFEQAAAHQGEYRGGTGLGLSITKKLVELHGGAISISSVLGEGTSVEFTLPAAPDSAEAVNSSESELIFRCFQPAEATDLIPITPSGSSGTVLAVDDEPINLQVIKNQLNNSNISVISAESGEHILELIERYSPSVILLDIMMPKINGFEVCRSVRSRYSPIELPILFISAKNRISDLVHGFTAGGNDYILKPFMREELIARVTLHMNQRNAYHALEENQQLKIKEALHHQELQQLQLSHIRISALLDTLETGTAAADSSGQICFSNHAAEIICGSCDLDSLSVSQLFPSIPPLDFCGPFSSICTASEEPFTVEGFVKPALFENEQIQIILFSRTGVQCSGSETAEALAAELNRTRKRIQSVNNDAESDTAGEFSPERAVVLMNKCIAVWIQTTDSSKFDFAEHSGLWKVQTDRNGWRRTQTLDRYLAIDQFPKIPRWRTVIRSVQFVLDSVPEEYSESEDVSVLKDLFRQFSKPFDESYY